MKGSQVVENTLAKYVGRHSVKERGYPPFQEGVLNWLQDHLEVVELLNDALRCSSTIDKSGIVLHAHERLTEQMVSLNKLLEWGIQTWDKQPGTIEFIIDKYCLPCRKIMMEQLNALPNKDVLLEIVERANSLTLALLSSKEECLKKYPIDPNY